LEAGLQYEVDVLIAGGGVIGSACAFFLQREPEFRGSIVVVEPDPSYRDAASSRSASSIRQQFSTPLNISLSAYGLEFLRRSPPELTSSGAPCDFGLVESSYLYLSTGHGEDALQERVAIQRRCGVPATLRDPVALAARYPWLNTTDLASGSDTAGVEGWFDGYSLLAALRSANERAGVRYVRDRIARFEKAPGGRLLYAHLQDAGRLACRFAVNSTGTRSRELAAGLGVELPVYARKRSVFVFSCPAPIPSCPLVIDPGGLWFRPEHDRYLCGIPADPDPNAKPDDFDVDLGQFETLAWPTLAHRVPAFEAIRMHSAWAGHYDYNTFDQNAFVGPVPELPGFLLASGFSGHGLQHAPGIGRALAEQIAFGEYRSLDLAPLSYGRFLSNRPLRELNVI
jgi:glycine/D-amino acid oxidase-like deaminating enzyme